MGRKELIVDQYPGALGNAVKKLVELPANMIGAIYDLLEKLGGKDGDMWLTALCRFLRKESVWGNIFLVKMGGKRGIAAVVEASGYTGYDPSIIERCELQKGYERWATVEIFDMKHFDHDPSDAEVEAEYVRRGLKRPDVDHAVHFGEQYQNLPVERHPIIFYLRNPVLGAGGFRSVLGLWRDGAVRGLDWGWLGSGDRWDRDYRFAGVRE